jgi:CBS domain-containing protein
MLLERVDRVPIVDRGLIVGIVTSSDILAVVAGVT